MIDKEFHCSLAAMMFIVAVGLIYWAAGGTL